MPTRSGRPLVTSADLASRLSALQLPPGSMPRSGSAGPAAGGWLPEQARHVESVPSPDPAPVTAAAVDPTRPPSLTGLLVGWIEDRLPLWAQGRTHQITRGALLGVVLVTVVLVGGVGFFLHHRSAGSGYAGSSWPGSLSPVAGSSDATSQASAGTSSSAAGSIVVDVGGKVRHPGLVTLPPDSRVADAIAAAGGARRHRDIATMDLAAKVGDGQLLLVGEAAGGSGVADPASGDPSAGGTSGLSAPVSLSSADATTLETLPGIGPVTAQKIIDWRTAHNGFTSIEQLQQVPGIGPAHYAEVESLVTP